jgi:hypothetical protein
MMSVPVYLTPAPTSRVKLGLDGYLIKQLKRNYYWHLMCLLQFNEATAPRPATYATALPVETGRPQIKFEG